MAHVTQHYNDDSADGDNFHYPEPDYPYVYAARSVVSATPAVSHAPLPPPSVAPSHRSSAFTTQRRRVPERAYSDSSQSSRSSRSAGGDSLITPSLSASQAGNRMRGSAYARSQASQRAPPFVSREDLRHYSRPSTAYASSKPPTIITSPPRHPSRPPTVFTATSPSTTRRPSIRRLRSVLKKPHRDTASYTSSSSAPEIIADRSTVTHEPYIRESSPYVEPLPLASSPQESSFPVPPPVDTPSEVSDNHRSRASVIIQKTRFHGSQGTNASTANVSRHLGKPWDARSPPRLDSAVRNAPAFDVRGIQSIQLIVAGLPWSVHVRAGASKSRSRSRSGSTADQITVGDVVDSIYSSLNKSLTRSDVRAATNDTKKRIARAAAAAERESQRGEQSARTGKPCAARRIDFLGSRVWFTGLEKDDGFARREGYGATEHELKKVWVMRFSSSSSGRPSTITVPID